MLLSISSKLFVNNCDNCYEIKLLCFEIKAKIVLIPNNNHFLFSLFFLLISYMYFTINKRRKGYWRPVITIGLKVPDRQLHSQLAKYGR